MQDCEAAQAREKAWQAQATMPSVVDLGLSRGPVLDVSVAGLQSLGSVRRAGSGMRPSGFETRMSRDGICRGVPQIVMDGCADPCILGGS